MNSLDSGGDVMGNLMGSVSSNETKTPGSPASKQFTSIIEQCHRCGRLL